jgi:DNA (cytosine-5)-methyltransferase 1
VKYLSVCSGIEAASVAWHRLGWQPVAFSEIEAFPSAVLAHHYQSVPNWGDMTKFKEWPDADVDVLVGGTPCQSFSVAGLRGGLADPRGNLALTYLAIAKRYRARWVVWENVPGVLSADGGRAFGAFLGGLAELGYGFAWRVLDAQFFGLAQRRKRVFVVGHLGDWRRAAAVLFESASLRGDPAPSRETGKGTAPTISSRPTGGGGLGTDFDCDGGLISACEVADGLTVGANQTTGFVGDVVAHALRAEGFDASEDGTGRGVPLAVGTWPAEVAPTINAHFGDKQGLEDQHALNGGGLFVPAVALDWQNSAGGPNSEETFQTLCKDRMPAVAQSAAVRRLTPRECERLQGFPDDYTLIPVRGKPAADGPRYKALGNSMAVPVMRWIGLRIQLVETIVAELEQVRVA